MGDERKRRQFCCTIPISSPPSPMPTFSFISPLAQLGFAAKSRNCYIQFFAIRKGGSALFVCVYTWNQKLTITWHHVHLCLNFYSDSYFKLEWCKSMQEKSQAYITRLVFRDAVWTLYNSQITHKVWPVILKKCFDHCFLSQLQNRLPRENRSIFELNTLEFLKIHVLTQNYFYINLI